MVDYQDYIRIRDGSTWRQKRKSCRLSQDAEKGLKGCWEIEKESMTRDGSTSVTNLSLAFNTQRYNTSLVAVLWPFFFCPNVAW